MAVRGGSGGGDHSAPSEGAPAGGEFACNSCGCSAHYDVFGRTHPSSPSLAYLEDAFLRVDPFSEVPRPLCLGSPCSQCSNPVCTSRECSLFYSKRFCLPCALANAAAFPIEMQSELRRAQAKQKQ